jgi:hypothetical protein
MTERSAEFPGFDRLFTCDNNFATRCAYAQWQDERTPELLMGTMEVTAPAVRWRRSRGTRIGDVVWTDFVGLVLISDDLAGQLRQRGITGWSPFPTECVNSPELSRYVVCQVQGRSGGVRFDRGTWIRHEEAAGPWKSVLRGLFFDENTWDGSDIFCPAGTGFMVVTEKVVDVIRAFDTRNVGITPMTDVEIPELVVRSTPSPPQ